MTPTRFPLHTERSADIVPWLEAGWSYCGEHPSLPGFAILEWREKRAPVAPFRHSRESIDDEATVIKRAAADLDDPDAECVA